MTPTEQICELIRSFPCLRSKLRVWLDVPGKFDADEFEAMTGGWSHGEILCALFVLNVWNPGYAKEKGWTFDLFEFIGIADGGNKKAVLDWMENPFWP